MVACVAFPIAVPGMYDYQVPPALEQVVGPGTPVKVELRSRQLWGVVVRLQAASDHAVLKPILEVKGSQWLSAGRSLVRLYEWIASYYQCDLGRVFKPIVRKRVAEMGAKSVLVYGHTGVVPEGVTPGQAAAARATSLAGSEALTKEEWQKKHGVSGHMVDALVQAGVLLRSERRILREAAELLVADDSGKILLTEHQSRALDVIAANFDKPLHPYLLYGITGSGKTHVYIELARRILAAGRGVIVLVPEISLTPQTIARFRNALGNIIAVIHSRMSDGERRDSIDELVSGRKRMVIGVRSAILAPMEDVGLIVVDEEHDGSYKQSGIDPRYNARDVAVMRGAFQNALVVLGSATPSFETYHNALTGKYGLVRLSERFGHARLPAVEIVDMNAEHKEDNWSFLSRYLHGRIEETLRCGRQAILLLNRRGFATTLMCKECGHTYVCPNCSVNLIYHLSDSSLKCHQCGHDERAPHTCAKCRGEQMKYRGTGIQKAEQQLRELFPGARLLRMDQDSTRRKGAHISILDAFAGGEADVLLGTQMVAKGLDFPGVMLVGVLQADIGLHFPDFRASERTFQLLTQVAGRAGRTDHLGEVVIQTYSPQEHSIRMSQSHDFETFFTSEIEARRALGYPPFGRLARIVVKGKGEVAVRDQIDRISSVLRKGCGNEIQLLGPVPAILAKLDGAYRYSLLLKAASARRLQKVLYTARQSLTRLPRDVRVAIDVDPADML